MSLFNVGVKTIFYRFYLMMAIILIAFFAGIEWLAFLSFPLFLSILLGVRIDALATVRKKIQ